MWSVARYDLSLSWTEFEELTPLMFQALCKRRNIRIRYERYAAAIGAAATYNVHRSSASDKFLTPYDFVKIETPEDRRKAEEEHNRKALRTMMERQG